MPTTRVFRNGNSKLSASLRNWPTSATTSMSEIERVGDELRIRPARRSLAGVLENFAKFSRTS